MVNLFNLILAPLTPSTPELVDITDLLERLPGKTVKVNTEHYGVQLGTVEYLIESPFVGETDLMAYVVSLPGQPGWSTYVPAVEVM